MIEQTLAWLTDPGNWTGPDGIPTRLTQHVAISLLSPDGLRPLIANWPEVALYFLRGVQADANADGSLETAALLTRLLALPDVPLLTEAEAAPPEEQAPVLPIHFRRGNTSLLLFTTLATLGTPRDVTLDEVRIDCFFPMDDATEAIFRNWAAESR